MNKTINKLFDVNPFQLDKESKYKILLPAIGKLDRRHKLKSNLYKRLSNINKVNTINFKKISEVPFIPVQLFKTHDLISIDKKEIVKTLTSSGTTGEKVSKIYLDKETSFMQTKALVKIISDFIGSKRLPMIIIDSKSIFDEKKFFTARAAGILGMANFGRDHFYALDEEMKIDLEGLQKWLKKHQGQPKFMFGFTYMIWQYLYQKCKSTNKILDFSNTILFHSGGWKKMIDQQVNNKIFKYELKRIFGLNKVHNFYGMVESVGSIYVECEMGFFHSPSFSEIIIRRHSDWSEAKIGEEGIIQVISTLAKSYPGHSILTEDLGTIHGIDDCKCGRKGNYFSVSGRVKSAEIRGCSDTHIPA